MASGYASRCLPELLPKTVGSKSKQCRLLKKASGAVFNSSFDVKMASCSDKTTAVEAFTLISLAAPIVYDSVIAPSSWSDWLWNPLDIKSD